MKWFYRSTVCCLRGFFRLFYRLSIYGIEDIYQGKAILAPNHASFLDPPLIGATWPEEVHFLARASLFRDGLCKGILSRLNAHPVQGNAQDIASFRLLCQLLSEEKKVVIFPEGERSASGKLQTIKSGIAMLALRMHCPIIPVYIQGTFEAWPKHRHWPILGSSLVCVFGQPIFPCFPPKGNKKQMQDLLIQQVQEEWKNLKLWLETQASP